MRKSSLILMLVAAFVLVTAAVSFSADSPCKQQQCKSWNWDKEIALPSQCVPTQGHPCNATSCPTFDFENKAGYCTPGKRYIIMKVCDCPDYDPASPLWGVNATYGFRVEILDPQKGVYFTNQNESANATGCATDGCTTAGPGSLFTATVLNTSDLAADACPDICTDGTPFGFSYQPVDSTKALYDSKNPVTPCCLDCIGNLTTAVVTSCAQKIFQGKGGQPYVMLDIPTMVWDPKVINEGDIVKIKVTLISGEGDAAICGTCKDLCSCIEEIGVFGCVAKTTRACMLCMPYFTSIDDAWWSGFAVTNSGAQAANVTVQFYAGGVAAPAITETIAPHSVMVKALSELDLSALAGKGPIYASVIGTVPSGATTKAAQIDGFAIMGDGSQAYGYLAKHGPCGCTWYVSP